MNLGDHGTSMYIVAEGYVNIYLPGEASRRISLKDIARGEYFGELALFDDKPRGGERLATTDACCSSCDRDDVVEATSTAARRPRCRSCARSPSACARPTRCCRNAPRRTRSRRSTSKLTWSQKLADRVAELNGSWTFIIMLFALTVVWVVNSNMR